MVKDRLPFLWSCPDPTDKYKRITCQYSVRYGLPCGTQRTECEKCYMYQQYLGDHYNKLFPNKRNVHICDRCGEEITRIDLAVYLDISNRAGQTMITQELCFMCASELIDWAQKKG